MNFFLCFPFLNTKLSVSSTLYKQYLLLRKIVNFLMATEVNTSELNEFENDVERYLELNQQTGQSLTLKIHHLVHYSDLIREFGPLINYSTLRFERLHQIGKNAVINSKNRVNLPYQIATAYSKAMANGLCDDSKIEMIIGRESIASEFPVDYSQFIDSNDNLTLLESTSVENTTIKAGQLYLAEPADDSFYKYPIFFFVEFIVKQNSSIRILGHFVKSITFEKQKYSYLIRFSEHPSELVRNIAHYRKLTLINHETDEQYVSKDFHVNYNLINYSV